MRFGQVLLVLGTIALIALFAVVDTFNRSELWNLHGDVATAGRVCIAATALGAVIMAGAFVGKIIRKA